MLITLEREDLNLRFRGYEQWSSSLQSWRPNRLFSPRWELNTKFLFNLESFKSDFRRQFDPYDSPERVRSRTICKGEVSCFHFPSPAISLTNLLSGLSRLLCNHTLIESYESKVHSRKNPNPVHLVPLDWFPQDSSNTTVWEARSALYRSLTILLYVSLFPLFSTTKDSIEISSAAEATSRPALR